MIHLAHLQINALMEDKYVRKNDRKEIDNRSKKGWWYRTEVRVSLSQGCLTALSYYLMESLPLQN